MTPAQLEPSAHAPCSSTIVGLGPPPPAAWAAAALAGAIWLTETSSPATARTTAISMIRILERRIPWIKFTAVFPSCWCENLLPGRNVFASVGSLADTPVSWPGPGMYGAGAGSPRPASAGAVRQARHLSTGLGSPAVKPGCRPGIPRMRTLTSQADGFWHRQAARAAGHRGPSCLAPMTWMHMEAVMKFLPVLLRVHA